VTYKLKFPTQSFLKKFEKKLKGIPQEKIRNQIMDAVEDLADNPRPYGEPKIKPPIKIYNFVAQYRLRIRDYRVLYDVDDKKKTVWVLHLRKRNKRTYH